jgi:predicted acylesterase/phospholipase RssA
VGLTLIQRSSGTRPPKNPKVALVLAGGAVTGGAFKVGGLKALDEFLVGRRVTDFDSYIGLSAGAFLATSLAAGVTPDEMIEALEGTSERLDQLRPIDFYNPNVGEVVGRGAVFSARLAAYLTGLLLDLLSVLPELPAKLGPTVRRLIDAPSYTHLESLLMELYAEVSPKREFPSVGALLPSGIFDNAPLERWLATNMAKLGVPNYFADFYRETGRRLYITATNLDTAERVLFGPENDHGLTISEAVRASSALPGFFRPARINGVDYVDGGIRRTANIDVAVEQGADLIICYNPFRPYLNDPNAPGRVGSRYLSDRGLQTVMNQVLRTLLHTRLAMGLRAYMYDEHFRGDIVVIEARETDEKFFDLNPLVFWRRADAVQHGLESVRKTLLDSADVLQPIFARYGIDFRAPSSAARATPPVEREGRPAGANLRVVSGGGPS